MTTLLASQEDYAASRGIIFDPTDLAALISLEGASDAVRSYTGQTFDAVVGDVITLDGTHSSSLLLPQLPVNAVTEVASVNGDRTLTVLDPNSYWLEASSGILWRNGWGWTEGSWPDWGWGYWGWDRGHGNIQVTYDHGYTLPEQVGTAPPLPADIQVVVMQAAARMHTVATAGGQGITAETIGTYSVTYGGSTTTTVSGLNGLEQAALERYRYARVT